MHDPLVYTHADRARWYDVALLWGRVWGFFCRQLQLDSDNAPAQKTRRKDHRGFVACSAPRLRKGQGWTHWLRHFSLLGSAFGIFVANTGENIWHIGILVYLYLINISMRLYMIITVMYLHIILIFCFVFCAC